MEKNDIKNLIEKFGPRLRQSSASAPPLKIRLPLCLWSVRPSLGSTALDRCRLDINVRWKSGLAQLIRQTLKASFHTLPSSALLQSITIVVAPVSQTILQKSLRVCSRGHWAAIKCSADWGPWETQSNNVTVMITCEGSRQEIRKLMCLLERSLRWCNPNHQWLESVATSRGSDRLRETRLKLQRLHFLLVTVFKNCINSTTSCLNGGLLSNSK